MRRATGIDDEDGAVRGDVDPTRTPDRRERRRGAVGCDADDPIPLGVGDENGAAVRDYEPVGRADPDVRPKPALADSKDARIACVIERAVAPCRERPDGRGAPCNDATAQTADRLADGDEDGSGRCAYDRVRTDERWHEHRHPPACRVDAQDSARVVLDDEDLPTRLQFDRRRLCERQRRAGKRDKAEGDKTDHASILGRSEPAKPTDRRRRTRLVGAGAADHRWTEVEVTQAHARWSISLASATCRSSSS